MQPFPARNIAKCDAAVEGERKALKQTPTAASGRKNPWKCVEEATLAQARGEISGGRLIIFSPSCCFWRASYFDVNDCQQRDHRHERLSY